jgi:DNA-damage-inducible protein D
MKSEKIADLFARFEMVARQEKGVEYWLARELLALLGYTEWRNFTEVIARAKSACAHAGQPVADHFVDVNKMVELGSNAWREIDDVALTRYAAYLVAQNGDPRKEEVAFAQTYFAVQTRKQELIEQRLQQHERVHARTRLAASEKELSGVIFGRLGRGDSFAGIRSKGDEALFGGITTQQMKDRLGVPNSRPLADFLPTITIKAKDFANEITIHNTKDRDLRTEHGLSSEHSRNNAEVRKLLGKRGIKPEALPPAEDVRKVERRLAADTRRLTKARPKKRARRARDE